MAEGDRIRRTRSRRRKQSREREILQGVIRIGVILLIVGVVAFMGGFACRYWLGSQTPEGELEISREVIPETMGAER